MEGSAGFSRSEKIVVRLKSAGSGAGEGESPVSVSDDLRCVFPSNTELLKFCVNLAGPPVKPKYS